MQTSRSLAVSLENIKRVLSYRRYAVLAASVTVSLTIMQISVLLMLFYARFGFNYIFEKYARLYFPPGSILPTLEPENTLFQLQTYIGRKMIMLSITPLQFFQILLISALVGIYVSLILFYRRNCVEACRREGSIGAAALGVGGAIPIFTSSISAITGCCGSFLILPLISGIASSFLEVGFNIFGINFSELFRTVGVIILVISIFWSGNKIKVNV